MLTMAILAVVGAFIFGFVLCGMFTVGAAADRSDRPKRDDGRDFLEVALPRLSHRPAPLGGERRYRVGIESEVPCIVKVARQDRSAEATWPATGEDEP